MKMWQVEIHWEPATTIEVEAETQEEAEDLAISEAGQPEVDHCETAEVESEVEK